MNTFVSQEIASSVRKCFNITMCLARTTKLTEELANIEIIYMIDMKTKDLWQTAYLNGLQKYN